MNLFSPNKFARGTLVGVDGNAFTLLGHFSLCAKNSGWTTNEIELVTNTARESSYDHLVSCLVAHLTTNTDNLSVGLLFDPISEEEYQADKEKLESYIETKSKNKTYPFEPLNPNSYLFYVALAAYEIVDCNSRSLEFFYKDDGVDRCGSHAVFLEDNTNAKIEDLFSKLRNHLIDDSNMYENFLAHLLKQVLILLDANQDRDFKVDFEDYECYYAVYTCDCCAVVMPVDQMSDEYGSWRCMECCEDEDEDEDDHDFNEDREDDYEA